MLYIFFSLCWPSNTFHTFSTQTSSFQYILQSALRMTLRMIHTWSQRWNLFPSMMKCILGSAKRFQHIIQHALHHCAIEWSTLFHWHPCHLQIYYKYSCLPKLFHHSLTECQTINIYLKYNNSSLCYYW